GRAAAGRPRRAVVGQAREPAPALGAAVGQHPDADQEARVDRTAAADDAAGRGRPRPPGGGGGGAGGPRGAGGRGGGARPRGGGAGVDSLGPPPPWAVPGWAERPGVPGPGPTPRLERLLTETPADSREHLHASLALLGVDPSQVDFLFRRLPGVAPAE